MDIEPKLIGEKPTKLRQTIRYVVAVAASILLIFILVEGYNFYSLSPDKLFAEKYESYRPIIDTNSSKIEKAYDEKNYGEVIRLNRNLVLSTKDIFLTGMAYLETRDYSRAVSSFQIVIADIKDEKTTLKDTTEYYLALAYLEDRDYDQAIELMNSIHDNTSHLFTNRFNRNYISRVKRLKWR
jgi:tetratricopeptide (TPR) repeat protein